MLLILFSKKQKKNARHLEFSQVFKRDWLFFNYVIVFILYTIHHTPIKYAVLYAITHHFVKLTKQLFHLICSHWVVIQIIIFGIIRVSHFIHVLHQISHIIIL